MKMPALTCALLSLVFILSACSSDTDSTGTAAEPELSTLTGTVYFEVESPLPIGRSLTVQMVDVTDAEGAPPVVASTSVSAGSASPHSFSLVYDPGLVQDGRQYLVYAELQGGGQPTQRSLASLDPFATETLTLRFARPKAQGLRMNRTISLQGIKWYLDVLGEEQLDLELQARPYIEISRREDTFAGFAGCNTFTGTYTLEGTSLGLGQAAVTRKACESGMDLESRFLAMLSDVGSWRLDDGEMVLGDDKQEVMARFILESAR